MNIIKLSMIIIMGFAISGCASSGSDMSKAKKNNRTSSTQTANLKCNAGEIMVCKARDSHRVSDGRYGRKGKRNQKCSCQPEADLSGMGMDVIGGNSN
jgi:hypothetical protein